MTRCVSMGVIATICCVVLAACSSLTDSQETSQDNDITTVYLIRHAEKQGGSDPDLTAEGQLRAEALANVLRSHNVGGLWSSDFARTRQTLAPLSEQRKVPVTLYDVYDSPGLVSLIMDEHSGELHVIAGHSNTVPGLVDLFEAWPQDPDADTRRPDLGHDEYDRLFVVTLKPGQPGQVQELRY